MYKTNHIAGEGNAYNTLFREYDPNLGRWWSLDPLRAKYPGMSPYLTFKGSPINYNDPYGTTEVRVGDNSHNFRDGNSELTL
jgi:RHS repeat-associated protein